MNMHPLLAALIGFFVLAALSYTSNEDFKDQAQTADVIRTMDQSREAELNAERKANWAHHMAWGDEVVAMGSVEQK